MKRHTFKPGDLVINSGRLLGQGYVWRVEEVWQHCPYDPADRRPWMSLKTITTLARLKDSPNTIRVSYTDGQTTHTIHAEIYMIGGLRLNDHQRSQTIEVMRQAPGQQRIHLGMDAEA